MFESGGIFAIDGKEIQAERINELHVDNQKKQQNL
jgi:hypothetical protein